MGVKTFAGHDTGSADHVREYRPLFLDHFDREEIENFYKDARQVPSGQGYGTSVSSSCAAAIPGAAFSCDGQSPAAERAARRKLSNTAGTRPPVTIAGSPSSPPPPSLLPPPPPLTAPSLPPLSSNQRAGREATPPFEASERDDRRPSAVEHNFDFLRFLTYENLRQRTNSLDSEMERRVEELRKRYENKRRPILDTIDLKRRRQRNLNREF